MLLIVGLPRSGTSYVYRIAIAALKPEVALYEPFNLQRNFEKLVLGSVLHDVDGVVRHDLDKLLLKLTRLIVRNSTWILHWLEEQTPSVPYLGEHWREILDELHSLRKGAVVVKEVFIWPLLREVVEKGIPVVVLLRDFRSLAREFAVSALERLRYCMTYRHCKATVVRALRVLLGVRSERKRIRRTCMRAEKLWYLYNKIADKCTPVLLPHSLSVFAKYFNLQLCSTINSYITCTIELLREVYLQYQRIVKAVECYSNVQVVSYVDRLSAGRILNAIRSLKVL